jgi:hypothetical protein
MISSPLQQRLCEQALKLRYTYCTLDVLLSYYLRLPPSSSAFPYKSYQEISCVHLLTLSRMLHHPLGLYGYVVCGQVGLMEEQSRDSLFVT